MYMIGTPRGGQPGNNFALPTSSGEESRVVAPAAPAPQAREQFIADFVERANRNCTMPGVDKLDEFIRSSVENVRNAYVLAAMCSDYESGKLLSPTEQGCVNAALQTPNSNIDQALTQLKQNHPAFPFPLREGVKSDLAAMARNSWQEHMDRHEQQWNIQFYRETVAAATEAWQAAVSQHATMLADQKYGPSLQTNSPVFHPNAGATIEGQMRKTWSDQQENAQHTLSASPNNTSTPAPQDLPKKKGEKDLLFINVNTQDGKVTGEKLREVKSRVMKNFLDEQQGSTNKKPAKLPNQLSNPSSE
jgi:hypothetical protein